MKHSKKAQELLTRMGAIERMERGKLCRMKGRDYYNLQAWHNGRNEVRYIREEEREAVQEAVDGYQLFQKLAQAYADEVIKQTRKDHKIRFPKSNKNKNSKS